MAKPDICVAIPTYQREVELIDTIKGILNQTHKNLVLMVIDQSPGHEPQTEKALGEIKDPRFRYYLAGPPSLPAARNFALRMAEAPIVLFLDDDIVPSKDLVKYHLLAFKEHPDVSAVAGRVMQKGFPVKKQVLRIDEFARTEGVFTATEAGYTNAFPGGNHALKVKDALLLGGFDTRYYGNAFREESDMAVKMAKAGFKVYFEPRAELLHLAAHYGGTRVKGNIQENPLFYRNEMFFTLRATWVTRLPRALWRKYRDYCRGRGFKTGLRRSFYFALGFLRAVFDQLFATQIITKERAK